MPGQLLLAKATMKAKKRRSWMFIGASRVAVFTGLLVAALAMPAVAAEVDSVLAEATLSDQPMVVAASATTQPSLGPVIARESLASEPASQVAVVGTVEPTRSTTNLSSLKRARAARAARAARYSSYGYGNGNGYRSTPLILGVRF
jgi:hypothetical protein